MCFDPISLITLAAGAGLSAAGGAMQRNEAEAGARRQANARNATLDQYLARQRRYSDEAQQHAQRAIGGTDPAQVQQQMAEAEQGRADAALEVMPQTDPAQIPTSGSAPEVVRSEIAKRMLEAHQQSTDRAKALARVGSFGDSLFRTGIGTQDAARKIDTVNNFARGDIALLPYSQQFAEVQTAKPSSGFGDLLKGAGVLLGAAGGSGQSLLGAAGGSGQSLFPSLTLPNFGSWFGGSGTVVDPLRRGFASPMQRA